MSICPKNKTSKARRDKRRANWKMSAPNLVRCSKCGELMMPTEYARHAVLTTRGRSSLRTNYSLVKWRRSGMVSFIFLHFLTEND